MAAPHTTDATRTEDEMLAAVAAGHEMAGMPLTDTAEAAARRVLRGDTSADEEIHRLRARFQGRDRSAR